MRCPKCSFISFDDLAVCAKCAGDLSVLSKELNGTCIEARPEFFLGAAIQAPSLDDENFSDSQMLPPIDHGGINFDDTSTGGFSPVASSASGSSSHDFDDSMGLAAEDDVAIELGDIMPIDLDQLDDTSVFSGVDLASTDSFSSDNFALDLDRTETFNTSDNFNVDLDLTGKFASTNLDMALDGDFSDIDLDESGLDFSGETPSFLGEDSDDAIKAESGMSDVERNELDSSVGIDLDDELIAQLSTFVDDPDNSSSFSTVFPSEPATAPGLEIDVDDSSGSIEFDDALVAELTGSFPAAEETSEKAIGSADESFDDIELELDSIADVNSATPPIEDLTGEYSSISYGDEPELGDLNLADIDVADLLEPSFGEKTSLPSDDIEFDTSGAGVDLAGEFLSSAFDDDEVELDDVVVPLASSDTGDDLLSLGDGSSVFDEVSAAVAGGSELSLLSSDEGTLQAGDSNADLFDEIDISELDTDITGTFNVGGASVDDDALPEIELIPEDDEGPPDLPS